MSAVYLQCVRKVDGKGYFCVGSSCGTLSSNDVEIIYLRRSHLLVSNLKSMKPFYAKRYCKVMQDFCHTHANVSIPVEVVASKFPSK